MLIILSKTLSFNFSKFKCLFVIYRLIPTDCNKSNLSIQEFRPSWKIYHGFYTIHSVLLFNFIYLLFPKNVDITEYFLSYCSPLVHLLRASVIFDFLDLRGFIFGMQIFWWSLLFVFVEFFFHNLSFLA